MQAVLELARTFGTEEFSRDVDGLAAYDHDLLSIEKLFRDCRGETPLKMAFPVNDDLKSMLVSAFVQP